MALGDGARNQVVGEVAALYYCGLNLGDVFWNLKSVSGIIIGQNAYLRVGRGVKREMLVVPAKS